MVILLFHCYIATSLPGLWLGVYDSIYIYLVHWPVSVYV